MIRVSAALTRAITLICRAPGHAVAFVLLTGGFLVSRMIFLDRDLPPWSVAQLQPIDEFFYTISGFDLYRYGWIAHRVVDYVPTDAEPTSLLENAMTAIALALFGNNYYGLRVASVCAGLSAFVILYFLLRRHVPPAKTSVEDGLAGVLPLLLLGYLVADYGFDMAARVAEPTIFQILAMALVLIAFSSWPSPQPSIARAFWLGAIAAAAWLFVYILNAFVVAAVLLTLVVESRVGGMRRVAAQLSAALAGCAAASAAWAVIIYLEYQETPTQVFHVYIRGRGTSILASSGLGISSLHARAVEITSTNIFRFDLPVLLAFGLALPVFLYRMSRERDTFSFLVAALTALLLLQYCVVPDSPQRKLVLLSPLIVLIVGMAVPYVGRFMAAVGSSRAGQATMLLWLAAVEYWVAAVYRAVNGSLDSGMKTLSVACVALLIGVLVAALIGGGRLSRALAVVGCFSAVLPGVYFSAENLWIDPTYRYRDAMTASAPYLNGHVTAGGYSYSFRLYNSSVPVLDPNMYLYSDIQLYWQYLSRLFREGTAQCLVTNADGSYGYLGLKQVAKFEIDVEDTPAMGLYCR